VAAALADVTAAARESHLGLALGTCTREPDGRIYDALRFYAPDKTYLGFHSKILLCGTLSGTLSEPPVGEINEYATCPLRTFQFGDVTVGGLICNDLWANPQCVPMPDPHLTQQLARLGARLVFHAVNGGRDGGEWSRGVCWNFHESNLRMRAAAGGSENQRGVWIVKVDSSQPIELRCSAPGGVIDPQGEWVCRAEPQGERFFVHTIEIV
jgi:predicted amidohydrolase